MKRETLVVLVKLVLDTSLPTTEETAIEIRSKLKMKMMESEKVKVWEAHLIGCVAPDLPTDSTGSEFVN